jgi:hypothetical protein
MTKLTSKKNSSKTYSQNALQERDMNDSHTPTPESPVADDMDAKRENAGFDRRSFLKISSAAAAAAVAAPGLAPDKKQYPTADRRQAPKDLKGGWFVV